jgi:hypothetical protein
MDQVAANNAPNSSGYAHTQKAPLCLFIYGAGVACFVLAWAMPLIPQFPNKEFAALLGIFIASFGPMFHHLTVADKGEYLAIRFGPVPIFSRTVRYAEIESVEVGRTLLLESWGVHYSVRGGWVWNLWGRACVVVHFKKRVLRIGTDDAENLARFLGEKKKELDANALGAGLPTPPQT